MEVLNTLFALLFIIFVVAAISAKVIKITVSSAWYKKWFAQVQNRLSEFIGPILAPIQRSLFAELDEHLKRVKGDVLEIGIGSGANFQDYPQGTSLIAVDANPHVEKLLKKNLAKAGDRILLKKFVVASAEDMSFRGKVGVKDNSVAAVVCTKLLCSLTDEQVRKTVQEVKRVLMPVSLIFFMPVSFRFLGTIIFHFHFICLTVLFLWR